MAAIHEADRVYSRTEFIVRIAKLLAIPVIASEQNNARMGGTASQILDALGPESLPIDKMSFSCCGCSSFQASLESTGRKQAVLVGIETHICVSQTALDLQQAGLEVFVCPDAVSARTVDRHKLGMERLRDSGIMPAHTESVAYEWLQSAEDPKFREALKIVKQFA